MNKMQPIERYQFPADDIMSMTPPRWQDRNKKAVFEISCPAGAVHHGQLEYSRWTAMSLPPALETTNLADRLLPKEGFYDYVPIVPASQAIEWHVNFADPYLFVAYGSSLLAQDEMQVAEHPVLGGLREALQQRGIDPMTIDGSGPSPILIMGAERRITIATDVNAAEGRPFGLYGNNFARAAENVVKRAVRRLQPPTITHLVAMAAPTGGYGRYRDDEIEHILVTAYTGFNAARLESLRVGGPQIRTVIHTGYWGCGAFGGNRKLMAMLQLLAAGYAGVEKLVFHAGDGSGISTLKEICNIIQLKFSGDGSIGTRNLIREIDDLGFEWGISDGN